MQVQEIDSLDLHSRLALGDGISVVDIRSDEEVAHGTLPEALHLPMHLLPLRLDEVPCSRDVVLFCRSGARSYQACNYLLRKGFNNVINLRGGILGWARRGLTIAEQPVA